MFRFYSGLGYEFDDTREAITLAIANNDKSMVPVMIEMLRFWGIGELGLKAHEAIAVITGHELGISSRAWHVWMEWLGKNADDYRPPDRYVEWKVQLMNQLDPRFGDFLAPAAQGSRINVVEIVWGGVVPDGIPDLQNAPVVSADGQDYLLPSDRVFGVSINGEHRAYPLRIVNAHEMAKRRIGRRTHRPWPIELSAVPESCIPPRSTDSQPPSALPGCCTEATRSCTTGLPTRSGTS